MKFHLAYLIILTLLVGCSSEEQYDSFSEWYEAEAKDDLPEDGGSYTKVVTSHPMKINGILRSMEGPFDIKDFSIDANSPVVWLKGYKTIIKSPEGDELAPSFMCHNNLNIKKKEDAPWKVKTLGTKTRLFTLTEGQTDVMLPEGFAVPVTPDMKLELISQVLNHNDPDLNQKVCHEVAIRYIEDHQGADITPLYQQSIFVAKQTAGPKGPYGSEPRSDALVESESTDSLHCAHHHNDSISCAVDIDLENYNPFQDQYGRKYTGHWVIDPVYEELHTNVTPMLNLKEDTKVHYIGVHVHPFSESLELRDMTTGKTVWKAKVKNHEDRIGIEKIDYYSSVEGKMLYADHQYELVSIYRNTTEGKHTAMASMFLYLEE